MADRNRKQRSSFTPGEILLFLAGILFCLVLISTSLLGGLFARYTTSGTGHDNARVAKFGNLTLTETGDFVANDGKYTGIIIPGVDMQKKVQIHFGGSEMATYLFVKITAVDWFKIDKGSATPPYYFSWGTDLLKWTVDTEWTYLKSEGSDHIFYKELPPPSQPMTLDVIQNDTITVSPNIKSGDIVGNPVISFQAYVIQNDGSLTPATAWDRLK